MEIRLLCVGRLPGGVEPRLGLSFHTIKIHAPFAGRIELWGDGFHWDRKFGGPPVRRFIEPDRVLKAAFQVSETVGKDVEVNLHAVGANFKFLVIVTGPWVGLKKGFGDVAIPKVIAPAIGVGIRKYE